ncbi:hypothetical protein [Pseudoduganella sp. HUAS MS19]
MFAMLVAVSAPTLSTLLSAACGDNSAVDCHAKPTAHHMVQKCGYCMVQADLPPVPPPFAAIALALMAPSRAEPALQAPAALPQQGPVAPPSRAPPSA